MNFEIVAAPSFWFPLTDVQLSVLQVLSERHYDGVCRQASAHGGFIYGWGNARVGEETKIHASWNQLDTCCKILEGAGSLDDERSTVAFELTVTFRRVLTRASELCKLWKDEVTA